MIRYIVETSCFAMYFRELNIRFEKIADVTDVQTTPTVA